MHFPDIEQRVNDLPQSIGLNREQIFPFGVWMGNVAGTLGQLAAATTSLGFSFDNNAIEVLRIGGAVTQTSFLWTTFAFQSHWRRNQRDRTPILDIAVRARKVDLTGSAAENADLALLAQLSFCPLGSNTYTAATAVSWTLPAKTLAASPGTALDYTGSLLGGLTEAQLNTLVPGTLCKITLSTQELVGTDLAVLIQSVRVGVAQHLRSNTRLHNP